MESAASLQSKAELPKANLPRPRELPAAVRSLGRGCARGVPISLLAAVAVDLGFGVGYVSDVIAGLTTAYATALAVGFSGLAPYGKVVGRLWFRLPVSVAVALSVLALLRGPLLFDLPISEYATTGHSPYFVFPFALVSSLLLLVSLTRGRTASTP